MQLVRTDASMTLGHGSRVRPLQPIQRSAEPLTQALGSSTLLILITHVLNYEPYLEWGRFDCEDLQLVLWQWHQRWRAPQDLTFPSAQLYIALEVMIMLRG